MALTILAQVTAEPGKEEQAKAALLALIPPTRAEAGCLQYDMHADNANPGFFVFFEIWESPEHWQKHMESDHIKAHGAASRGLIADVVLNQMTQIA